MLGTNFCGQATPMHAYETHETWHWRRISDKEITVGYLTDENLSRQKFSPRSEPGSDSNKATSHQSTALLAIERRWSDGMLGGVED